MRVRVRHRSHSVSSGGGVKSVVMLWNMDGVEPMKKVSRSQYITYPVEAIDACGSSMFLALKTSLDCSVILFWRRESALVFGTYPWYLGITQFFLSTDFH